MLLPGLGQLMFGRRQRGLAMIGVSAAVVLALLAITPRDPFAALALAVQPRNLAGLLVIDLALLLFRVYAVVDAFRGIRGVRAPAKAQAGSLALLALVLAITAAPHVVVGYYDVITWRFLDKMFDGGGSRREIIAPAEVELTREIRLKEGVIPAAPPLVPETEE